MHKPKRKPRPTRMATRHLRLPDRHPSYSAAFIDNLTSVIAREGIKAPILIDERRVIHSGMALFLAACRLNLRFVPVVWLDLSNSHRGKHMGFTL